MLPPHGNLFGAIPAELDNELTETLVARRGVKIERIVSRGHVSPSDFWYDQDQHELVYLVAGSAELEFEGAERLPLGPGDWVQIDAHVRHRVHATAPDIDTIWLVAFSDP